MSNVSIPTASRLSVDHEPPTEKMPGHWLLARMGKRVLRPGGIESTRELLQCLAINPMDDVVDFAPGIGQGEDDMKKLDWSHASPKSSTCLSWCPFGVTARMTLACRPRSYTAIDRDRNAAAIVKKHLTGRHQRCVLGTAEDTGLPELSASVVYGEAMLSLQPSAAKSRIIAEAARLLKPGGRYGIHELCLVPDDLDQSVRDAIRRDLSDEVHVGVRPLTSAEWRELPDSAGLAVVAEHTAPMHLLEPKRLVRDGGVVRAIRFGWNVARHPVARRRVLAMRKVFREYHKHLAAIALVARRRPSAN